LYPVLIVLTWLVFGLLASVLVVAALALSSQISKEEVIEQHEQLVDTAESEQLTRFPHSR